MNATIGTTMMVVVQIRLRATTGMLISVAVAISSD